MYIILLAITLRKYRNYTSLCKFLPTNSFAIDVSVDIFAIRLHKICASNIARKSAIIRISM